jgi:orotate phosphoribosyltransferase
MRLPQLYDEHVRSELLTLIKQFAYARKDVILNSGAKSNFYIDCKQVSMRPDGANALGRLFFDALKHVEEKCDLQFDACGGMAMGALPISMALTLHAFSNNRILPSLSIRKEAKDHGTKELVEGPARILPNARVLMVEDAVTTGRATLQAARTLREAGFVVEQVIAIVDREAGGEANLAEHGLQLHSLYNLSDFHGAQ